LTREEKVERIYIDVSAHSQAAPEVVFGLLADGASWPLWSPIESFELERPGNPPPEGVGAIRVFRKEGTTGRDQIVELVPGRRLSYVSLSGPPVRDYRAEIDLEGAGEGTAIKWRASFSPRIVGTSWLLDWGLRSFLEECARGVAEHAAHVPPPTSRRRPMRRPRFAIARRFDQQHGHAGQEDERLELCPHSCRTVVAEVTISWIR
jgi:Polyketide cyclase / dehydrase and lipid transport